jgi:GWxTD domain-containing protein
MQRCEAHTLLVVVALAMAPAAADPPLPDDPSPDWRKGPIRYILNVKEDGEFKELAGAEERRAFIERFWAALDPTPGTEINERRVEFWKRVEEADRLFQEALVPGWKTDRGTVYILMGPPDERLQQGIAEIWTYQALPKAGAAPGFTVRFRKALEGQYRMPTGALIYRDPLAEPDGPPAGPAFLSVEPKSGSPQIMKGRIRMTEFPRGETDASYFVGTIDFHQRYDFHKAEGGATRAVVTLAMPEAQFRDAGGAVHPPDISLSLGVEDAGSGASMARVAETMRPVPGVSRPRGGPFLFQSEFSVQPGTYRASFVVFDRVSHLGSNHQETFVAPDFDRGLALSTVAVGRMPEGPSDAPGPLRKGVIALISEPDALFHPGESVGFAYQVYNARHHRGEPDLDVEYRFFMEGPPAPRQIAKPILLSHQKGELLAYTLTLSGWPEAGYLVRILVTDNLTRATTTREEKFRVVPSPGD